MLALSCSNQDILTEAPPDENNLGDVNHSVNGETLQAELNFLEIKTIAYNRFTVALSRGYDTDLTGYVPNMGHHFANMDLVDGIFDLDKPETLLYVPDTEGNMQFVGVEYLILREALEDPNTPPEGFTGSEDDWEIVGPFWTLHVWIALDNPDGIFAHENPNVPAESPAG
ncbi:hypothetical protein GCM10022260_03110 [Gaetbulibacter aestuarii]